MTDPFTGDPAALESLARVCDQRSADVSSRARRVRARADRSSWQCGRADRFRDEAAGWQGSVELVAGQLRDLATELRGAAAAARQQASAAGPWVV